MPHLKAALNNARWCDTVCRAHGVPGSFSASMWVNDHQVPPYHSSIVTLGGTDRTDAHRAGIAERLAATPETFVGFLKSYCTHSEEPRRGHHVKRAMSWSPELDGST